VNNEKKAPVLTMEMLAPYLPYGLKALRENTVIKDDTYTIYGVASDVVFYDRLAISSIYIGRIKPILRPLSEYKDINSKSMNNLDTDLQIQVEIWDLANKKIAFQSLSYGTAMECFANHIDIFGLIEKGLAININSIEGKETNNV